MKKLAVSLSTVFILGITLLNPLTSFATEGTNANKQGDTQVAPTRIINSDADLNKDPEDSLITPMGNGVWDLVATEKVTITDDGTSNVHSMNGDGVKVCFQVVSGTVNITNDGHYFGVGLMEKDEIFDDDYDKFNTEGYLHYSDDTCAVYSGVGGDPGDEELYMRLWDDDSDKEVIQLKWYD